MFNHCPPIKNRDDLLNVIYFKVGTLTFDEVKALVELVEKYVPLCELSNE